MTARARGFTGLQDNWLPFTRKHFGNLKRKAAVKYFVILACSSPFWSMTWRCASCDDELMGVASCGLEFNVAHNLRIWCFLSCLFCIVSSFFYVAVLLLFHLCNHQKSWKKAKPHTSFNKMISKYMCHLVFFSGYVSLSLSVCVCVCVCVCVSAADKPNQQNKITQHIFNIRNKT